MASTNFDMWPPARKRELSRQLYAAMPEPFAVGLGRALLRRPRWMGKESTLDTSCPLIGEGLAWPERDGWHTSRVTEVEFVGKTCEVEISGGGEEAWARMTWSDYAAHRERALWRNPRTREYIQAEARWADDGGPTS